MLAQETKEQRRFFSDDEAFFFSDIDGCVDQINSLMNMSDEETAKVREAARKRSLNSGYSYRSRALQVIHELENIH